ncbi:MAG: hypothetical protein ACKO7D_01090 [Bacteroidota bacterium]
MSKYLLISIFLILTIFTNLHAQVSLSGGTNMLNAFGVKKSFYGLHIGGELPQNNMVTFYGRLNYFFPRAEVDSSDAVAVGKDFTINPYQINVKYLNTTSFISVEGGTRSYIGNGFDNGFSGYGGGKTSLLISRVSAKVNDYNTGMYTLDETTLGKGSILGICLGLQGGIKYTFPGIGSIYLDGSIDYLLFATPSNQNIYTSYYPLQRILFITTLGFRKEFY